MQAQNHNTAMRNAFAKANATSGRVSTVRQLVFNLLEKGAGTRSKAMWAPLNPPAYTQ